MKDTRRVAILFVTICMVMILGANAATNTKYAGAKATKKALRYLSGTWHTGSMPGYKVKFTKNYVKYYADGDSNSKPLPADKLGKLEYKYKIVSTKKKNGKWIIKVKTGKNKYYYFKESKNDKTTLEYWGKLKGNDSYSGSSSLTKQ